MRPPDSPSYSEGKSSKGSVLDCAHPHPWNISTPTARPTSMLHYRSPTMHDLIVSIYIALTNVISLLVLSYCGFTIPCCWWMDGVHLKFGQENPHRNLLPGIQDCCSSMYCKMRTCACSLSQLKCTEPAKMRIFASWWFLPKQHNCARLKLNETGFHRTSGFR